MVEGKRVRKKKTFGMILWKSETFMRILCLFRESVLHSLSPFLFFQGVSSQVVFLRAFEQRWLVKHKKTNQLKQGNNLEF